ASLTGIRSQSGMAGGGDDRRGSRGLDADAGLHRRGAVLALCEPKALRYRFLHVAARLVHSGRRRRVKIPETWPWAAAIVAVFNTIAAIPKPA
ncbi:transposase, partial [Dietzia cinnamea]|nr:transposase [Dietzia cinnamea]MCT2111531.1 transposase [Dietzia cinnamea]MCT2222452.1 transposase [Dietzia cinnamea]